MSSFTVSSARDAALGVDIRVGGSGEAGLDIWFLPGFGKSQRCFRQAFKHPLADAFRIVTFDFPGIGASPPRADGTTVESCAHLLCELIEKISALRRVVLVAHSMGGIVATQAASMLRQLPVLLISVEGNLTPADAYYSGQAMRYPDCNAFYTAFLQDITGLAAQGKVPDGYVSCLQLADPNTLWTLGRSVVRHTEPGLQFSALPCATTYYWDVTSVPAETRAYLARSTLSQRRLDGAGHWPMLTAPGSFYSALQADILAAA